MLKIVAILVFASNLSVAVETDSGWAEQSFPNTEAGAAMLLDFAESAVGNAPNGVRVTVGWLDDNDNMEHIIELLARSEVKHGLTSPEDIRKAAAANSVPEKSALAVAHADIARFGFLTRRPKK
jgi:hypothetical protein